ncbi:phosphonate C-P lyase system protein PhnH [Laribacter hongkongensis]|uniref:phosphonate C-P lyase system protein PhnH n=1 Tax=Laribacter hongkongensis TaxID=168471 RepID=UPI001EFC91BD|nr:phosphonate C-P lyase system protein PhnH [Laribacter hongkongensis]MCG9097257.1 phosphonate C-P lyase system protein PhnH [Laribacter hongkongensis]
MMLQPQFDNPVHDAQQVFRTLLAAMAEPLLPRALPVLPPESPADLHPATAAALLTLLDGDVSLAADLAPATADWLRFHTGVRLTGRPEEADFVLVHQGCALPSLAGLRQGEPAYPDRSATLLVEVAGFAARGPIEGSGPGLARPRRSSDCGLPREFWLARQQAEARFPLGVDLLLFSAGEVMALPRSTRLTEV